MHHVFITAIIICTMLATSLRAQSPGMTALLDEARAVLSQTEGAERIPLPPL